MKSNNTTVIPLGEHSPEIIHPSTKRIINCLGRYHRGLETNDFIFYINYQEGDENGCVIMYRKKGMELASDNNFAYCAMFEILTQKKNEITYISPSMKNNLKLYEEMFPYETVDA